MVCLSKNRHYIRLLIRCVSIIVGAILCNKYGVFLQEPALLHPIDMVCFYNYRRYYIQVIGCEITRGVGYLPPAVIRYYLTSSYEKQKAAFWLF